MRGGANVAGDFNLLPAILASDSLQGASEGTPTGHVPSVAEDGGIVGWRPGTPTADSREPGTGVNQLGRVRNRELGNFAAYQRQFRPP